ncbi:DUF6701 domain-containing protein [Neptuniibacter halophilus]|uniref:DUF6701 domain-containing protein n=1 Tax=Neptuniibacter halophilus TaxID=651666 RepID=UPI0025733015|nr:DUF6701 domain-containing protein [Neptuniibacter halophilus]
MKWRYIGLITVLVAGTASAAPKKGGSGVSIDCSSSDSGVINELVPQGTAGPIRYIEVAVLGESAVDVSGWQLCTSDQGKSPDCRGYGSGNMIVGAFDSSSQTYDSGITSHTPKEYLSSAQTLSSNEWEVLLLDGSGKALDYAHFCKDSCKKSTYWEVPAACTNDLGGGGDNKVILARMPDGEGGFVEVDDPTPGSNNNGEPDADVDHYAISHSGSGVTCLRETVTISAHGDASHGTVDAAQSVITLSTSHGKGDWVGIASGSGALDNGSAGDGVATYSFAEGEQSVQLLFEYIDLTSGSETFSFNVTDGTSTETSGEATAADDPSITFSTAELRFVDASGNELIPTQISGKSSADSPFSEQLFLQAVRASDGDASVCTAAVSGTQTIQVAAQCQNPDICVAGQQLSLQSDTNPAVDISLNSASPAVPASYADVQMSFDAEAKAPFHFTYSDAGQIQLYARFDGSETGVVMSGSSNLFVVRPFGFGFGRIYTTEKDNPGGDELFGEGFVAAGRDFSVELNAYAYDASDDDDGSGNFDGIPQPDADLSDNAVTPNYTGTVQLSVYEFTPLGGVEGNLDGDSGLLLDTYSNRAGAYATAVLQYDEVGSMTLRADHNDYLGAADADISGFSPKTGRFYPDHFFLTDKSLTLSCSGFVYMQQPYASLEYRVEARAADDSVTENYDIALYNTDNLALTAEDSDDGNALSRISADGASLSGWTAGVVDLTDKTSGGGADDSVRTLRFIRNGGAEGLEDGPFSQVQLGLTSTEVSGGFSDGVRFHADQLDTDPASAGACAGSCTAISLGDEHQALYGRLLLQSAHGPETQDLPVPFAVEYWNGSRFVTNGSDSCSRIPLSDISFDGGIIAVDNSSRTVTVGDGSTLGTLNIDGTDALAGSGDFGLVFSAPGASGGGTDYTGYFPVGISSLDEWLRYDWNQDGAAGDVTLPDAIITFGRARGNDRVIFWREP